MAQILIVYGTTDGHTRKVADALAKAARGEGCAVHTVQARVFGPDPDPEDYSAVLVAGSVHAGGYQRGLRLWARRHADALNSMPSAFVSVCLAVLQKDPKVKRQLEEILHRFYRATGWNARRAKIVAGGVPYTRYGFLKKRVMKRICAQAGGGTDTTRDYDYTDWAAVDRFGRDFVRSNVAVRRRA